MQKAPITKYQPFPQIDLPDRQWPSRVITAPPIWCSVDLRDGNQALAIPMSVEEKLEMFQTLVNVGFKEIEIGFPSASQIEFDFCRRLIEEDLIPEDVTVQVLVQAREELIRRTFEALRGARQAIVHLYNSTNPAQRRIVFGMTQEQIKAIAMRGTALIKELAAAQPETQWALEYSPESFVLTELDYALEVCEAVVDVWQPTVDNRIILNLPATVEVATPNVHADQIEWFCRHLRNRETAIISLHTHNDRGTGIAATELGLLAGADRVEGTLFGNGERTGNVDIVTVALNMYTQGVDPLLDFSDINATKEVYEHCTRMTVPVRQPYAGELVFTAFSGSHQDAINKGLAQQDPSPGALWQVPYLPIDPNDIGRSYEKGIIRINSQSGKGGVAYIIDKELGYSLPKKMRREFGGIINELADEKGRELSPAEIRRAFEDEYLQRTEPIKLDRFFVETNVADVTKQEDETVECIAHLTINGIPRSVHAVGDGPIDAFVHALRQENVAQFDVIDYEEYALSPGSEATAIAFVQIKTQAGKTYFGAAIHPNIVRASIEAVVSAVNRFHSQPVTGSVASMILREYGFQLPKLMRKEFGEVIDKQVIARREELSSTETLQAFEAEYLERTTPIRLDGFSMETTGLGEEGEMVKCTARLTIDGVPRQICAEGDGPIDAFVHALRQENVAPFDVIDYEERALSRGSQAKAVAYIQIRTTSGMTYFGAAVHPNILLASIKAVVSAVNRSLEGAK